MTQSKHSADERAQLALAAYLEPLLRDQRVLLIDEPASAVSSHLAGVADLVQVVAPDELAIAGSHADAELDLPLEADVFDVIWVAEVAALSDPKARAVDAFRNALEGDGVLVLCAQREAEALPQRRRRRPRGNLGEALARLARGAFEEVRLLQQSAFDGYALEGDTDGAEETALDQSLLRSERPRPARYVALASDLLPSLESSLVVRVPAVEADTAEPDPELAEQVSKLDARLREVADEADLLRAEVVELEEELERTREQLATTLDERDLAVERLDKHKEQAREDRAALKQYKKQAAALERDVEQLRRAQVDPDELEALRSESRSLDEKLVAAGAKIVELEAEVERRSRLARDLVVDLENLQSEGAHAKPAASGGDGAQAEVDALAEREIALYAADELRAALEEARETSREQIRVLQAELDEARQAAAAAQGAGDAVLSPRELSGSALIARDSERVRVMGAELLTYRQQATERDQLAAELEQTRRALAEHESYARGLELRLDEAERALEQRDDELPTADEIAQLQEAVEKSSLRVRELSEKLAEALRQVTRLETELGEADRQVEEQTDLVSEVEKLGQQLGQEQERATDLQQSLREADDEREQLRQQLQAREHELEQARRERDEAREGLSEARNALQEVAAQRLHDSAEG